ncbi:MAG: nickel pincer cofactor biosynthesis protein LarB [Endomicrobiia bacterium]
MTIHPDLERFKRQGFPEAVYCPGKTIQQIINITKKLYKTGAPIILTRADKDIYNKVKKKFKKAKFYPVAKLIIIKEKVKNFSSSSKYVAVVTAGTSDVPVAEECAITCETLGTKVVRIYDVGVAGMHRLFKYQKELTNADCIVVVAGMEGALPSIVAGLVSCPVIGVPTSIGYGSNFNGISALLTMLNSCSANVCCVNIDDGFGAGVIAHLITRK